VLQGIAAQVAELAALVEADLGQALTRLRVDGGLTQSRTLMQATADLMQIPIDVYPSSHATALGVAAFARLALESDLTLSDSVPDWKPGTCYEPAWSVDRAHEICLDLFEFAVGEVLTHHSSTRLTANARRRFPSRPRNGSPGARHRPGGTYHHHALRTVDYRTRSGDVHGVRGVDLTLRRGEVLGIARYATRSRNARSRHTVPAGVPRSPPPFPRSHPDDSTHAGDPRAGAGLRRRRYRRWRRR
jgi:hypothetical protein